jgi:hypothetical protein
MLCGMQSAGTWNIRAAVDFRVATLPLTEIRALNKNRYFPSSFLFFWFDKAVGPSYSTYSIEDGRLVRTIRSVKLVFQLA